MTTSVTGCTCLTAHGRAEGRAQLGYGSSTAASSSGHPRQTSADLSKERHEFPFSHCCFQPCPALRGRWRRRTPAAGPADRRGRVRPERAGGRLRGSERQRRTAGAGGRFGGDRAWQCRRAAGPAMGGRDPAGARAERQAGPYAAGPWQIPAGRPAQLPPRCSSPPAAVALKQGGPGGYQDTRRAKRMGCPPATGCSGMPTAFSATGTQREDVPQVQAGAGTAGRSSGESDKDTTRQASSRR